MARPSRKWYDYIPHSVIILFGILVLAALLSYLLPAGVYERISVEGRQRVVPGSFHLVEPTPVSLLDLFRALPLGFKAASEIIFVVLSSGIMFGVLERSGAIENAVGSLVRRMGLKRRATLVFLLTYLFGLLGVFVGYENNIAMVPIAAVISLAIGGDLILAAGLSVGAITVGFGLSPINPYTVGTGHQIAELPMFSGALLRGILCFAALTLNAWYNLRYYRRITADPSRSLGRGLDGTGLTLSRPLADYRITGNNLVVLGIFVGGLAVMLYGIFQEGWFFLEISAIFCMISVAIGVAARLKGAAFSEVALQSVALVAPGAFMVGYATSIKVVLEMGQISDSIAHYLSQALTYVPPVASAVLMSMVQSVLNLLIPSGSGQALATLPIMVPLGDLVGITRQTTILAFQIGDGVTNLFNPALGGMIAMLGMCRVPFDRWLRYVFPLAGLIVLLAWGFLVFSVLIGWGPA